jgi:hypothetical protein
LKRMAKGIYAAHTYAQPGRKTRFRSGHHAGNMTTPRTALGQITEG